MANRAQIITVEPVCTVDWRLDHPIFVSHKSESERPLLDNWDIFRFSHYRHSIMGFVTDLKARK